MRVLLCALNAKYIHSNLAVHYLREYARFCFSSNEIKIEIEECTINQHFDEVLKIIYEKKPDLIGFSCYIWNISYIKRLIVEVKKVLPMTKIWLGGPEVSYNAMEIMENYQELSGIVRGEGEGAFAKLLMKKKKEKELLKGLDKLEGQEKLDILEKIEGITYRDGLGQIKENPISAKMDINYLPFPYENIANFNNRIIYYETSRGCPYSCSYCLSSTDKEVRFKDLNIVKEELGIFIENNVSQVKFVDRTFNCDKQRARQIWRFIQEKDNGRTNFHFEIAGDLLEEEDLDILSTFRQGLAQFEIGVQSTNLLTLNEIKRVMDFDSLKKNLIRLKKMDNINLHLDLIAGLPEEGIESFAKSFDNVYQLKAGHLQLGFLKLLKGSTLDKKKDSYDLLVQEHPPYEVLATKWLDFNEILRIKTVEEMVENYYNSGQFYNSINLLEKEFDSPFQMYESLGAFYKENNYEAHSHSREKRYEIIFDFLGERLSNGNVKEKKLEEFRQLLILDYYLRENPKKRPGFAGEEILTKEEKNDFYTNETIKLEYLKGYEALDKRKIRNMTHLESINGQVYLFDYLGKNNWNQRAKIHKVN
jgi:radical SAM superfamily enzyme YgiQ (UPF0313 family)